ncbi:MAG: hypothetical protein ABIQ62_03625 [Thermomonas sp.]
MIGLKNVRHLHAEAGEPQLAAPEGRNQQGGPSSQLRRNRGMFCNAMDAGLGLVLLKLFVGLFIVLFLTGGLKSVLRPLQKTLGGDAAKTQPGDVLPMPQQARGPQVLQSTRPKKGDGGN